MIIDPEWRRKGIAWKLLEVIEKRIIEENKVDLIKLETGVRKNEGSTMYKKFGFENCEPFSPISRWELGFAMQKRIRPKK